MKSVRHAISVFRALVGLAGLAAACRLYISRRSLINKRDCLIHIPVQGFPTGLWIRPRGSDLDVFLQIFWTRHYDISWCEPYKKHIENAYHDICLSGNTPLIIDAGANIGASTLWFARNFPKCRIFAVEPDRENFCILEKNTRDLPNVTLFNAGLWDKSTNLSVLSCDGNSWARRVQEDDSLGSVIPSVTVADLLNIENKLRPVIVKIDIEGAETSVFRTNTNWADDVPLIIFEPHDNLWGWLGTWQGTGHAFFHTLSRRKREYLFRGENVFAFLHPTP